MLSTALLLTVIGTGSSLPQLNIPANDNIFRSFPVTSGGGVRGEVTSISVAEDNSRQTQSGRDLLDVLNSRAGPRTRTKIVTRTRPVSSSQRVVTSSSSDDGSSGPPMPYSFSYDVAGDKTQTYISRQEESDGETVTGSYSYVDPTGALIIVTYRAGAMGYTETRERQDGYLEIRPSGSSSRGVTSSSSSSTSSSSTGSSNNRFSSRSSTSRGAQQLTTTLKKKKTVDQQALIAKILAALGPQLSSIVDNSIGEFETVTEEKVVTVKDLPTITSTFEFNEQSRQQ